MGVEIKVEGAAKVGRELDSFGVELESGLDGAWSDIDREGVRLARRLTPRRTGRLASDVRVVPSRGEAVIAVGQTVVYAGVIDHGWRAHNITGAFFMEKASDQLQPYAVRRLEREIDSEIRKKGLK